MSTEVEKNKLLNNLITLKDIKICKNIKNRSPIGIGEVFPNSIDSLYCYTKIENLGKKMEVRHVWYYENQIMTQVRYNVKKSNVYRSWTKKTISSFQIGNWRVEVQDRNGTIIDPKDSKLSNLHNFFISGLISLTLLTQSCGKVDKVDKISMNWSNFDLDLPDGLEVYVGLNDEIPLKAWVAKIDLSKENVFVKVLSSNDKDQLSTPMQFLKETGAKIIINGGYFNSEKRPVEHVGLLKNKWKT